MYELHACMNDDVELYCLKAKSNQFKTLRQVDDSILDELDDVDEVIFSICFLVGYKSLLVCFPIKFGLFSIKIKFDRFDRQNILVW